MWSGKSVNKITKGSEISEEDLLDFLDESEGKQGLWDNIRKKKKRMGKKYRPARPGEKDRPDAKSWKKAQKKKIEEPTSAYSCQPLHLLGLHSCGFGFISIRLARILNLDKNPRTTATSSNLTPKKFYLISMINRFI